MSVELSVLTNIARPKQRKASRTVDSSTVLCSSQDLGQFPSDLNIVIGSSFTKYHLDEELYISFLLLLLLLHFTCLMYFVILETVRLK